MSHFAQDASPGSRGILESPQTLWGIVGDRVSRWIAVAGGCGYAPLAPGTVGSLFGVLLFVAFCFAAFFASPFASLFASLFVSSFAFVLAAPLVLATLIAGLFVLGCWAAGRAEVQFDRHDDGRIVIDEVVGQLIALFPLVLWMAFAHSTHSTDSIHSSLPSPAIQLFPFISWVVTGFVLFRLFDVWKPGPIRWAERNFTGGVGVMADDVVAGVFAALGLVAIRFVHSFVFGASSLFGASTATGVLT